MVCDSMFSAVQRVLTGPSNATRPVCRPASDRRWLRRDRHHCRRMRYRGNHASRYREFRRSRWFREYLRRRPAGRGHARRTDAGKRQGRLRGPHPGDARGRARPARVLRVVDPVVQCLAGLSRRYPQPLSRNSSLASAPGRRISARPPMDKVDSVAVNVVATTIGSVHMVTSSCVAARWADRGARRSTLETPTATSSRRNRSNG